MAKQPETSAENDVMSRIRAEPKPRQLRADPCGFGGPVCTYVHSYSGAPAACGCEDSAKSHSGTKFG